MNSGENGSSASNDQQAMGRWGLWSGYIISAIDILQHAPLIGRTTFGSNRELIIGKGSHGYVALYRYLEQIDTVFVLAIRAQREAGYR